MNRTGPSLQATLVALAALGAAIAAWAMASGGDDAPLVPPRGAPVAAPDPGTSAAYVGASGVIEPASESVSIGPAVAGVVVSVHVRPGDSVRAGDTLFEVEARDVAAEYAVRRAALRTAEERIATAEASLQEARVQQSAERRRAERAGQLVEQRALSREDAESRIAASDSADARLARAIAAVAESRAAAAEARARAEQARIELDRRRVVAPRDGTVLRVEVRPGEFAPTGRLEVPLMTLGETRMLHARVEVDEADIPRLLPAAPAVLSVRGGGGRIQARFVRVEPLVVPKRQLSGSLGERVDTRVLQVIYAFDADAAGPAYPGQQVDAYLPARPG